nr:LysR family transcriptional regulator substrate-binding protein [Paenibacillus hamazuiensis]
MLLIKKDTYNRIKDLIQIKEGTLSVGLTPERGTEMFSAIYPLFYKKYPDIKIEPVEVPVKRQQHEIAQGKLDIGFLTLQDWQKTSDHYVHVGSEPIILGVPKAHPLAHAGGTLGGTLPQTRLKLFENDTFAIMRKGSTLREIYDRLIAEEGIAPHILLETRSCQTLYEMVAEGICCSVFPISYAKPSPHVSYFSLPQNPVWEIAASYKKDSYLSKPAQDLIAFSIDYWSKRLKGIYG